MKTQKQISKLIAAAAITVVAVMPSFAQSTLGAACGCPPVASRPTVSLTSLPGTVLTTTAGAQGWELSGSPSLTCDKTYILDAKVYVGPGQVISIQPGTVIKALAVAQPSMATALVIERGGKILASGTEDCPIVFTAFADPMDGSYSIANKGLWGGLVILGKAHNNLTLAANGPYVAGGAGKLAVADGLGTIEGFATSNPQDRYGANINGAVVAGEPAGAVAFDNNDNSGVLRYVSIRHSGAILAVGAEINGLTLGSVGKGTSIEHIEIISCADDNIELFGGTVDLKYATTLFGNDDMFDYDLGWTGRAQFLFGMKGDLTFSLDNDNGFEADGDDNRASNNTPRSHPVIYNSTIVGNAKSIGNTDNSGIAAIFAKELTEGEFYNSVFANFKHGFNMQQSLGSRTLGTSEAYHNWSATSGNGSQSLKVKCNTFVGVSNLLTVNATKTLTGTPLVGADLTQFTTTDLNNEVVGNTLTGFNYDFTVNTSNNQFSVKNDVIPNPALSTTGCPVAPVDGFFVPAAYRGAFASTGDNWLSAWSYSAFLGSTQGLVSCPTDIDKDGDTDVDDFSIFAPAFGSTCN
jgi:hypothetical protein